MSSKFFLFIALSRLERYGVKIDSNDPNVQKILNEVKDREFSGYSYDGADASFELLANRLLGKVPEYLKVDSYDVTVSKSKDIKTKANVTFIIDNKKIELKKFPSPPKGKSIKNVNIIINVENDNQNH